ncbi:MAG TPA: hypothetical protein VGM32_14480 [Rhodopila sp.]|jgi:hypothetical protein
MNWVKKLGVLASLAMIGAPIASSFAQGMPAGGGDFMTTYVQAHDKCPGLSWHINRAVQPDKTVNLSGPIWYDDGSGVSFARGTGQPDGHFTLNVKMMSGSGPDGTITGQRKPDGSVEAKADGPPCFAGTVHLAPGQTSRPASKM